MSTSSGAATADTPPSAATIAQADAAAGVTPLEGSASITAAAQGAAREAARTGADEVSVVAVDADGRPNIVPASPSQAVSVALDTAQHLDVVGVEVDSVAHALGTTSTSGSSDPLVPQQWALAAFPFSALWACARGAGVTVAVVDTGVQANHPDLQGRVLPGVAFVNGVTLVGGGATDVDGHGTHVAGIIAAGDNGLGVVGVAPSARILPVRTLDATGSGLSSDIAKGITWAVDHGANVINLSLGSDAESSAVDAAVAYATSHNVDVVAAAGNTGPGAPAEFPAALPAVIAVAALDEDGTVATYSTRGSYVDVAAPGTSILSTYPPSTWARLSGTSMASPHVAGLVALVIGGRGKVAPSSMLSRIKATATDAGPRGADSAYGAGRINPIALFNATP
jgi:subtilisin family serine protease